MTRPRTIGKAQPAPQGVRREIIGANGYRIAEEDACNCGAPLYVGDRSYWDTRADAGPYCSVRCLMDDRGRRAKE